MRLRVSRAPRGASASPSGESYRAGRLGPAWPGALRLPADLLLPRRPGHRSRDPARRARPVPGPDGLQPPGRRLPEGQVPPRRERDQSTRWGKASNPPVEEARGYVVVDGLDEIAARHGATVAQVALARVMQQPGVSSVLVGATRVEQLPRRGRAHAHRGGPRRARRGQPAGARVHRAGAERPGCATGAARLTTPVQEGRSPAVRNGVTAPFPTCVPRPSPVRSVPRGPAWAPHRFWTARTGCLLSMETRLKELMVIATQMRAESSSSPNTSSAAW